MAVKRGYYHILCYFASNYIDILPRVTHDSFVKAKQKGCHKTVSYLVKCGYSMELVKAMSIIEKEKSKKSEKMPRDEKNRNERNRKIREVKILKLDTEKDDKIKKQAEREKKRPKLALYREAKAGNIPKVIEIVENGLDVCKDESIISRLSSDNSFTSIFALAEKYNNVGCYFIRYAVESGKLGLTKKLFEKVNPPREMYPELIAIAEAKKHIKIQEYISDLSEKNKNIDPYSLWSDLYH